MGGGVWWRSRGTVRAGDRGMQCGSRSTVWADMVSTRAWATRGVPSSQKLGGRLNRKPNTAQLNRMQGAWPLVLGNDPNRMGVGGGC